MCRIDLTLLTVLIDAPKRSLAIPGCVGTTPVVPIDFTVNAGHSKRTLAFFQKSAPHRKSKPELHVLAQAAVHDRSPFYAFCLFTFPPSFTHAGAPS